MFIIIIIFIQSMFIPSYALLKSVLRDFEISQTNALYIYQISHVFLQYSRSCYLVMENLREKVSIQMNDITKLHVDAIVNAGQL